jgi:hypothetical protein
MMVVEGSYIRYIDPSMSINQKSKQNTYKFFIRNTIFSANLFTTLHVGQKEY